MSVKLKGQSILEHGPMGPLMGGPDVACRFKEKAMSHVSVAFFHHVTCQITEITMSHITIFFTTMSHVT